MTEYLQVTFYTRHFNSNNNYIYNETSSCILWNISQTLKTNCVYPQFYDVQTCCTCTMKNREICVMLSICLTSGFCSCWLMCPTDWHSSSFTRLSLAGSQMCPSSSALPGHLVAPWSVVMEEKEYKPNVRRAGRKGAKKKVGMMWDAGQKERLK